MMAVHCRAVPSCVVVLYVLYWISSGWPAIEYKHHINTRHIPIILVVSSISRLFLGDFE